LDESSGASACAESDVEFIFTFHASFVGEVDFEEEACFSVFSSLFSLVTESLSVSGTASLSGDVLSLGNRSLYLDTSPS
jgi:hypothetical protein